MSEPVAGEVLNRAKQLLESGWCQGAYCRSGMGREVALRAPWAKSWCPSGAIWEAARELGIQSSRHPAVVNAFSAVQKLCALRLEKPAPGREIAHWSDAPERTHAQVLALMDEALRLVSPFVVMVPPEKPAEGL